MSNDPSEAPPPLSVAELAEFGRLFDEHRTRLLAMLKRRIDPRLQARLDAEDILQDAYLLAQHKWAAFQSQRSLSPYAWLYRITLDCYIEYHRKASRDCRDPRREVAWPDESEVAVVMGLVDTATRPSQAAQRQELKRRMELAMGLLPDRDREILWMRHFDQLSYQEIAELLGITRNTAGVRYVRSVERLRRLWHESTFGAGHQHES
jgi:RNA polymerase sigma-70 factor (ECF subfamily)